MLILSKQAKLKIGNFEKKTSTFQPASPLKYEKDKEILHELHKVFVCRHALFFLCAQTGYLNALSAKFIDTA